MRQRERQRRASREKAAGNLTGKNGNYWRKNWPDRAGQIQSRLCTLHLFGAGKFACVVMSLKSVDVVGGNAKVHVVTSAATKTTTTTTKTAETSKTTLIGPQSADNNQLINILGPVAFSFSTSHIN